MLSETSTLVCSWKRNKVALCLWNVWLTISHTY